MRMFTIQEMLDVLVAFDVAINPEEYTSAERLTPEYFMDAPICKAKQLRIEDLYKEASNRYAKGISTDKEWEDVLNDIVLKNE